FGESAVAITDKQLPPCRPRCHSDQTVGNQLECRSRHRRNKLRSERWGLAHENNFLAPRRLRKCNCCTAATNKYSWHSFRLQDDFDANVYSCGAWCALSSELTMNMAEAFFWSVDRERSRKRALCPLLIKRPLF